MAQITAAAVSQLRQRTGLPMMDCKRALEASGGDVAVAEAKLREEGRKTQETRLGRETDFGRIGIYTDMARGVGAMVELKCESAPVAALDDTIQLAEDLAKQLATGPGAATPEELLKQPSPSKPGKTLAEQKDELFNRIREVFNVSRIVRYDGPSGGYAHHAGKPKAALLQVEGGTPEAAKDVSMHIVATGATAVRKEELPAADVAAERELQLERARKEGKPENILAKMVEGRMRDFYAARVLEDQPFVKDEQQTVGQYAQKHGMKLVKFTSWELGK